MQGSLRAHARIGADVARVAEDFLDVKKLTAIGRRQQGSVVRELDESLHRFPRRGPKLESIDDVEPELDQSCAQLEPAATVQRQVAACLKGVDQTMRAASGKAEAVADL